MSARMTQPYRRGVSRGPSPVLDRMKAGRAGPTSGAGMALRKAMAKPSKRKARRMIPRY